MKATNMLVGFRNYLHYHIKASKTYLHMRMRLRVTNLLQGGVVDVLASSTLPDISDCLCHATGCICSAQPGDPRSGDGEEDDVGKDLQESNLVCMRQGNSSSSRCRIFSQ